MFLILGKNKHNEINPIKNKHKTKHIAIAIINK